MDLIPHEFAIGDVYFPPLLIAAVLGTTLSWLTVLVLNRFRLSRFLYAPPAMFLAMMIIYSGLIGIFVIPS